ncbi:MAG: hypothetical protein ACUVSQ_07290 [Pseudanabaenaceae cyanobacterium]
MPQPNQKRWRSGGFHSRRACCGVFVGQPQSIAHGGTQQYLQDLHLVYAGQG